MSAYFAQGPHLVRIVKQGFVDSDFGTQFAVQFAVPTEDGNEYDRTAFLPLMDKQGNRAKTKNGEDAAAKTLDAIKYLGFPDGEDKLSKLDPGHGQHHSFVGQEINANCVVGTREDGDTKETWYINAPRSSVLEASPAGKDKIRKLDAMFGRSLKSNSKKKIPPTTTAADSKTQSETEQTPEPETTTEPQQEEPVSEADNIPF